MHIFIWHRSALFDTYTYRPTTSTATIVIVADTLGDARAALIPNLALIPEYTAYFYAPDIALPLAEEVLPSVTVIRHGGK